MPGIAASKNETLELTGALKLVGAEENILEAAFTYRENKFISKKSCLRVQVTWACTSIPITLSQMPDCLDRLVTFRFLSTSVLISAKASLFDERCLLATRHTGSATERSKRGEVEEMGEILATERREILATERREILATEILATERREILTTTSRGGARLRRSAAPMQHMSVCGENSTHRLVFFIGSFINNPGYKEAVC